MSIYFNNQKISGVIAGTASTSTGDATLTNAGDLRAGVVAYGLYGKVTGSMPDLAATTYTPTTTDQTIAAGKYIAGIQTIKGDANLIAGNIKNGVTIFGVAGTHQGGSTINNQNKTVNPTTSQQSVTADTGYTGLGTVTVNAIQTETKSATPSTTAQTITPSSGKYLTSVSVGAIQTETKSATPSTSAQTITPTSGKYLTSVSISAIQTETKSATPGASAQTITPSSGKYLTSVSVAGDADLVAGNIKSGVNIFGVTGTYSGSGGISPTGNIDIDHAGTIDVTNYATATVPTAALFAGINPRYKTENNIRKWEVSNNVIVDPDEGCNEGWVEEGVYPGITLTYNAVPSNTTITPTESSQTIGGADYMMEGPVTVAAISSTYVGSGITRRSSTDLAASGATVTVPPGYYSTQASKAVSSMTLPTAVASSATSGYSSKISAGIGRSTSDQYINIPPGYNASGAYYKINAVANGSATPPATISGTNATVSTGTNTLTLTQSLSLTPQVTAGYISSGTAANRSVSLRANVTTKAAATITPGTTNQTIASGTYLTGTQTIAGDADLVAANIKNGVQIFGVTGSYTGLDTSDATATTEDIIAGETAYVNGSKITGELVLQTYYTGSNTPAANIGIDGDIYLQS